MWSNKWTRFRFFHENQGSVFKNLRCCEAQRTDAPSIETWLHCRREHQSWPGCTSSLRRSPRWPEDQSYHYKKISLSQKSVSLFKPVFCINWEQTNFSAKHEDIDSDRCLHSLARLLYLLALRFKVFTTHYVDLLYKKVWWDTWQVRMGISAFNSAYHSTTIEASKL